MSTATAATIAEIVVATATVYAVDQQAKGARASRRAERKARQLENARENIRVQREKQKLLGRLRVQRAAIEAGAESSGATGSSSALGALSSTTSQAAGNIAFSNQQSSLFSAVANVRSAGAIKASQYQSNAAVASGIASVSNLFTDPKRNKTLYGS